MANQDLGTKRVCGECGAKFYDLNKNPMVCPKCGHEEAAPVVKAKRKPVEAPVAAPEVKAKKKPEAETDDDTDVVADADASLEELAAKELTDDDGDDDDLLGVDDDDEDDPFLPGDDDDDDDDDVSTFVPRIGGSDD